MSKLLIDKLTENKESLRLYQQESTIIEITELICRLMDEQGINRSELAERLNKTKGYISQLLDGDSNMTIRTVADLLTALGCQLRATATPLAVAWGAFDNELLEPFMCEASAQHLLFQEEPAYGSTYVPTWESTPVKPGCELLLKAA